MLARPRTALLVAALVAIGVVQIALGMAGDGDPDAAKQRTVRDDDSLVVDPEPVALADLRRFGHDTTTRAVMELFYWAQWGSTAGVLSSYVPRVVDEIGAKRIADAYRFSRQSLLSQAPEIESVTPTPDGAVVTANGLRRNAEPQPYTFNLERQGEGWAVSFDTLLANGLAAITQIEAARARGVAEDDPAAVATGLAAARRYRALALNPEAEPPPRRP